MLAIIGATAIIASAQSTVYNAVPNVLAPSYPSIGYQATQTSQMGDYITLAGTDRIPKSATVTLVTWAPQADWPALTNPAGWTHPLTFNIYSATPDSPLNKTNTLLGSVTQSTLIPWRPVADPTCANPTQWRDGGGTCRSGYAFNVTFDLSSLNISLPNDVILGIAYNTQSYGAAPIGVDGPYNSLNVGLTTGLPSVGTDKDADRVFFHTATAGYYTDGGAGGVNIFREDTVWSPNGSLPFKLVTGPTGCGLSENFDGVPAPTLPSGWVATNFAHPDPFNASPEFPGDYFTTSTTNPDSGLNSLHVKDQDSSSDKVIDSPSIAINSPSAVLSFRNKYDFETDGTNYFDGAVLEISSPNIAGGAFTDVTDPLVGGSFVSGGYDHVLFDGSIANNDYNPLQGRNAWAGNSGSYINTVVNLGPNVVGQSIKLRFRVGTDFNAGTPPFAGWDIDSISVSGGCVSSATLSVPSVSAPVNGAVIIPVNSSGLVAAGTISADFVFHYDPTALIPASISVAGGPGANGATPTVNASSGTIVISLFNAAGLNSTGPLVNITGTTTAAAGSNTALTLTFDPAHPGLNGGTVGATIVNGSLQLVGLAQTATITNSPVIYNGSAQTAAVSCSGGGAASIASGGTGTNIGSYPTTVNCAANGIYAATFNVSAGDFVINPAPSTAMVTNSPLAFTGFDQAAIVACSDGGAASNIQYTPTPANAVGTYAVTADCAAAGNYSGGTGISAGNLVILGATQVLEQPGNTDWFNWDDNANTANTEHQDDYVVGPGTPPLPVGSARLKGSTASVKPGMMSQLYQGTRLADVTSLSYDTYVTSGSTPYLQFDVDFDGPAAGTIPAPFQGRASFIPNPGALATWRHLDALSGADGHWEFSGAPGNGPCPIGGSCSLTTILGLYPNMSVSVGQTRFGFLFRTDAGGNSNVDKFTVAVNSNSPTFPSTARVFNFEPATGVLEQPGNTDWLNYDDTDDVSTFERQDDYVAGPATAPVGNGSARMQGSTALVRPSLQSRLYEGTRLADFTALSYDTYVTTGSAPYMQFDVDFDNTSGDPNAFQRRAYFLPNPALVIPGQWQHWETFSPSQGRWVFSGPGVGPAPSSLTCTPDQAVGCTRDQVLTAYPNLAVSNGPDRFGLLFRIDQGNISYVDKFIVAVNGSSPTFANTSREFNFEQGTSTTTIDCSGANGVYTGAAHTCAAVTTTFPVNASPAKVPVVTYNPDNVNVGLKTATATFTDDNYVGSGPVSDTFTITAKPITAAVTASNKVYDSTTAANITSCSLTGVVIPPDGTVTCSGSGTFDDKNVGNNKTVTVVVLLAGAGSGNYSVTSPVTTTANITPATLTATVDANDKIYDGNNTATLSSCTLSPILGTPVDDVTCVTTGTATFNNAAPGTNKPVNAVGLTKTGGDANNYTFDGTGTGAADITTGTLGGKVTLKITPATPVDQVTVNAAGSILTSGTTDVTGVYSITNYGAGSYTMTPIKATQPCNEDNGIEISDAQLVAAAVVGIGTPLTADQITAGKVSGLPNLSSFDAAKIAQKSVNNCTPTFQHSGEWKFTPVSRTHNQAEIMGTPITNDDYTAIMLGDVDGNYDPVGPGRPEKETSSVAKNFQESTKAVHGSLPTVNAHTNDVLTLPFRMDNLAGAGITSYQFTVRYDPRIVTPSTVAADLSDTVGSSLSIVYNVVTPGTLKVGVYGALPVTGDGVYANLHFGVNGGSGSTSPLSITAFKVNNGVPSVTSVDGSITVNATTSMGSIQGRVLTTDGRGVRSTMVTITNSAGAVVQTLSGVNGVFSFPGLTIGETYTINVNSRRFEFAPVTVSITDSAAYSLDITAIH